MAIFTRLHKETKLYKPDAIADGIEDASSTATDYVTEISSGSGIEVHPRDDEHNKVQITPNGMEVFQNDASVAAYGSTSRIGRTGNAHVIIDQDSLDVMDGADTLASFGAASRIGKVGDVHVIVDQDSLDVMDGADTLATFGESTRIGKSGNAHVVIDQDSLDVMDGQSVLATFGESTRIGKSGESHIELDYHSMRLIDREGSTYFHVSDLRDTDGYVEMTDYFVWDSDNPGCYLEFSPYSITRVTVNGSVVSYQLSGRVISFPDLSVSTGDEIVVVYKTADIRTKAFTIGTRGDGSIGAYSYSEGYQNVSSARYSHAQGVLNTASGRQATAVGYGNVAKGRRSYVGGWGSEASGMASFAFGIGTVAEGVASTVIGVYPRRTTGKNRSRFDYGIGWDYSIDHPEGYDYGYDPDIDFFDQYAFVVGNGTADDDRSNAFAVTWDGTTTHYGDVAWTALTLSSGATAYDSDSAPRYRRWGQVVEVAGAVKPKAEVAAGDTLTIGTLPTGCRPPRELDTLCQGSGGNVWLLKVKTNGTLEASRYRSGATNIAMPTSAWLPFNVTYMV